MKTHLDALTAALSKRNPLSMATIVVPHTILAEAVTRWFALELRKPELLFGVRILPSFELVHEIHALIPGQAKPTQIDPLAIQLRLWLQFRHEKLPRLQYFEPAQLREGPGYAQAFARTILDLDLAGLTPQELSDAAKDKSRSISESDRKRFNDIATIWKNALPNERETQGAAIRRAIGFLHNGAAPHQLINTLGAVHVLQTGFESKLMRDLHESLTSLVPHSSCIPIAVPNSYADGLSRVRAPDRIFEAWASRETEDRATVRWLYDTLHEIPGDGVTPDIAILASADRLSSTYAVITYHFSESLIAMPRGLDAAETAEGARILAVLHALKENLAYERMLSLLPWLRGEEAPEPPASTENSAQAEDPRERESRRERVPKTREDWIEVINSTGVQGGTIAHADGANHWCGILQDRWPGTRPYSEALGALVKTVRAIQENLPVQEVSACLFNFLEHVKFPPSEQGIRAGLRAVLVTSAEKTEVRGPDALEFILTAVSATGMTRGSLRSARIFIGTPEQAIGMPFRAVRMIGLTEGALPSAPREDSILPDALRSALRSRDLPISRDRILRQRFALKSILTFRPTALSIASARQDISGNERAPSAFYLDLFSALPKPEIGPERGPERGKDGLRVALERALALTRKRSLTHWTGTPATRRDFISALRGLGQSKGTFQPIPSDWPDCDSPHSAFDLIKAMHAEQIRLDPSQQDDIVGQPFIRGIPGITPDIPLHPSEMGSVLSCPHQFLLKSVLGWDAPGTLQDRGAIGVMDRGTIIHWIAEHIYRERTPMEIQALSDAELPDFAREWTERAFTKFHNTAFLGNAEALRLQVESITDAVVRILKVDRERQLGKVEPEHKLTAVLRLKDGREIHVKGTADRIEYTGKDNTSKNTKNVRIVDFKSGKGKTDEILLPSYDIQVVAYFLSLVAAGKLRESQLDALEFRFPENHLQPNRIHAGVALSRLLTEARHWLTLIRDIFDSKFFVRTVNPDNCKYCPYQVHCGDSHFLLTEAKLRSAGELGFALTALWKAQMED